MRYGEITSYKLNESKNQHLEHLEDELFNQGKEGTQNVLSILNSIYLQLAGHSNQKIKLTVKWDGAPSIVCGTNPENNKFFVATKHGAFAKTPKLNYTIDDVDTNHSGQLAEKLKLCLKYLEKLNIHGVYQGDLMFTEGDLDVHTIDGTVCYVFQPNTIAYAVPVDSKLGEVISRAKVGVVFHTTYSGAETLSQMSASFGANISGFKQTPDVWFKDADYSDVSGSVTLTSEESQKFKHTLDAAERKFSKIGLKTWNVLKGHSEFVSIFKVFVNSKIRQGHFLDEPRKSLADFITFYKARKEAEMSKLKTKKGKQTRQTDMDNGVKYFKENFDQLLKLIELYKLLHDAKNIAVRKLHSIQEVGTFIRDENGFKVTTPEGFVAIDHIGNAVKLVDRLEFSMQNFNAVKSWS